ncbi:3-ketoacyl-CoA synthase [Vigna angularis]|uniref:3-ketoacyl-CoA synthase n=1 Tax=Phaseolus angularis TaxID=3914 RepID=A0A8T0KKL8_PHAAN|nr:3-ketoacyl-CoA synthase [Vigna angularis]
MTCPTSIYLLDFSYYRPPNHLTVHFQKFIHHSTLTDDFLPSSLDFERKILLRFGLGKETYRQGRGRAGVAVRDMAGNLRKRRGKGQRVEAMLGLEEEMRKQTDKTVRRRSEREGRVVSG